MLGLDPGSLHTGYGVVDREGSSLRACDFGRISCPRTASVPQRLAHLTAELGRVLDRWQPDAAAVETAFHGRNTRSLIVLAQARGALLATLATRQLELAEISPADVKSTVTGYGRAEKPQVARMVRLLLGMRDEAMALDTSDALAVAICYAQRTRLELKSRAVAMPASRANDRTGR